MRARRGKSIASALRAFVKRNHNKFSTLGVNMAQRATHDFINVFLRVSHVYVCTLLRAHVHAYVHILQCICVVQSSFRNSDQKERRVTNMASIFAILKIMLLY